MIKRILLSLVVALAAILCISVGKRYGEAWHTTLGWIGVGILLCVNALPLGDKKRMAYRIAMSLLSGLIVFSLLCKIPSHNDFLDLCFLIVAVVILGWFAPLIVRDPSYFSLD